MTRKTAFYILLLTISYSCLAQDSTQIGIEQKGDSVYFSAGLRPLRQIAGAPAPFYAYFWELGDGRFSFDKTPIYAYRDTGTYQVRLYATNNYDDGKAPPTRPRPIRIKKKSATKDAWASHFFHGGTSIEMKINRYPKPGENFVTVIGYRNQGNDKLAGSIVLFYNERQFGKEGFDLADQRFYNQEQTASLPQLMASLTRARESGAAAFSNRYDESPGGWRNTNRGADQADNEEAEGYSSLAQSALRTLEKTYSRHTVLHFPAMGAGEEKFAFIELNTLPGMLQDTNATVGFSAMLIPDDPMASPEICRLDMQIVASHDPNRLLFESRRINYRFFRKNKGLSYRLNFQNTGTGPTRKIAIGIGLPPQLDAASFRLNDYSPKCPFCDPSHPSQSCLDTLSRNDSVYLVFKHIYLPGSQQQGIHNPDSTEGFVEYTVRFRKKPKKIPFSTRAAIAFDQQDPIMTNKATARFIKGLSPGFMAGYSLLPGNGGYSSKGPLQFGYVLAPYAPSRPYFQIEAFVGFLQQDAFSSTIVKDQRDTLINGLPFAVTGHQTITTTQRNSFEVTPLHYRYNVNKWLGIGAGAMVQVNIAEQTTTENKLYFTTQALPLHIMTSSTSQTAAVQYLGSWNAAPFLDLQIGGVRAGPVLGLRYLHLLEGNLTNRFFVYAGFKL